MIDKEKINEIINSLKREDGLLDIGKYDDEVIEKAMQEYGEWVREQTLEEVSNILQKEKDTWANQSIGYKAVESVENALQALKDNN